MSWLQIIGVILLIPMSTLIIAVACVVVLDYLYWKLDPLVGGDNLIEWSLRGILVIFTLGIGILIWEML